MRYLAAYLLLQTGGNANPSAAAIKTLLSSVGIETDEDQLDKLISELKGKSIDELIAEGSSKLASVPSGGGGGGAAPSAAAAGGAAPDAADEEKEEKAEEKEEESDDDMGFGLFD
jgi:large subunit ribosomal protein LP2